MPFGTPRPARSRLKSVMTMSNSDCVCVTMEKELILQFSPARPSRGTMACKVCGSAPH